MKFLTDLVAVNAAVNLALSDVERGTIRLEATLDRTGAEFAEVQFTAGIDPLNGASVANEDFVSVELKLCLVQRMNDRQRKTKHT